MARTQLSYLRLRDEKKEILPSPFIGIRVPFATIMWLPERKHMMLTVAMEVTVAEE